jgi:zinc transport system substrate-binding protein
MRPLISPFLFLLILALPACGPATEEPDNGEAPAVAAPKVIASNYPLYFFASEILGDGGGIELSLPAMTGDPADWRPDASAVADLQQADLILLNGAGYEAWLDWVTLPADRLLDTSASLSGQLIPLREETVHQHGPGGEHSHTGVAFTLWLDPELAIAQASAIERALSSMAPEQAASFRRNLAGLVDRLQALDEDLRRAFDSLDGQPLLFSHPVYQYLQARYGLNGVSLHWEPEESPSMKSWIELGEILSGHAARLMLWEGEPMAETRERLLQLNVRPVVFDPVANRPERGNFFDAMRGNLERLNALQSPLE